MTGSAFVSALDRVSGKNLMVTLLLALAVVFLAQAGAVHLVAYLRWRRSPRDVYEGRPEAFSEGFYREPLRSSDRYLAVVVYFGLAALALGGFITRLLNIW
ncbi:hypothetical protein ACIBXA_30255 [Micromonospora echinaurantiaca]|uniref:hypothetical protein n=1 Tax=Micromonospora echinaurantiaca TaxID=47857 RepID=UPI0037AC1A16